MVLRGSIQDSAEDVLLVNAGILELGFRHQFFIHGRGQTCTEGSRSVTVCDRTAERQVPVTTRTFLDDCSLTEKSSKKIKYDET